MSLCFDCKGNPCRCSYTRVKNSAQGIRCYSLPGYGLVKYWPKTNVLDGKIEVHLHVMPGEFSELDKVLEDLIQRVGKAEEYL